MRGLFKKVMAVRRRVVFRYVEGHYGCVWTEAHEPKYIIINLWLHEKRIPSRTYLHECLHVIHPEMSEDNIRGLEEALWNTLSARQRFLLSRKLFNRSWRTR